MPSLSREFKVGVKLHEKPAYRLAQMAEVNPNDLYKLMSGISQPKSNDQRIVKVGKLLGLSPDECFE
jgi:hypothetical protein